MLNGNGPPLLGAAGFLLPFLLGAGLTRLQLLPPVSLPYALLSFALIVAGLYFSPPVTILMVSCGLGLFVFTGLLVAGLRSTKYHLLIGAGVAAAIFISVGLRMI